MIVQAAAAPPSPAMAAPSNADEDAVRSIHEAAKGGKVKEVERWLDQDPGLMEARESYSAGTLLLSAVNRRRLRMTRVLLQRGANVNARDSSGHTALESAAEQNHEVLVSMLLDRGAEPNIGSNSGGSAVATAASCGSWRLVWLLLERGQQNIDARNNFGATALLWACFEGHAKVAITLLLAGADHTVTDQSGYTPMSMAQGQGNRDCADVIRWFMGELERAYVLQRARCIYSVYVTTQRFPNAPLPLYVRGRVADAAGGGGGGGDLLPAVEVVNPQHQEQHHRQEQEGGDNAALRRRRASAGTFWRRRREDDDDDDEEEAGNIGSMLAAAAGGGVGEEERRAVLGFVVRDLEPELFVKLMEGMRYRQVM